METGGPGEAGALRRCPDPEGPSAGAAYPERAAGWARTMGQERDKGQGTDGPSLGSVPMRGSTLRRGRPRAPAISPRNLCPLGLLTRRFLGPALLPAVQLLRPPRRSPERRRARGGSGAQGSEAG